ncbi:MAG: SufD family Fe-S cluster assembly protein [Patescibacteria group bacterium]
MTNNEQIQITKDKEKRIKIKKSGDYLIELNSKGAEAIISGSFLVNKSNDLNINLIIHHKAPNTRAETSLKAVGKDRARIKLVAKIVVDKNCNGVNSFLTERVLLLSDKARAEAIPDLEIESDDVKCSHAASVSSISEKQIFYLMSRGISKQKAEEMIVEGFLEN